MKKSSGETAATVEARLDVRSIQRVTGLVKKCAMRHFGKLDCCLTRQDQSSSCFGRTEMVKVSAFYYSGLGVSVLTSLNSVLTILILAF